MDMQFDYTAPDGTVMSFKFDKEVYQAQVIFSRFLHLCFWQKWDRSELEKDMESAGVSVGEFMAGIDEGKLVSEILTTPKEDKR